MNTGLLYPVCVNGRWGFIDSNGEVIIEPQFDDVGDYSSVLTSVKAGKKWGYIDSKGTLVIPPKYTSANSFSEGCDASTVMIQDRHIIINKSGDAISHRLDYTMPFSEGFCVFEAHGLMGYLSTEAQIKIAPMFDFAYPFFESKAFVKVKIKKHKDSYNSLFIDKTGKTIINCKCDHAGRFSEGFARVATSNERGFFDWSFIDERGNDAFNTKPGIYYNDFHDGLAAYEDTGSRTDWKTLTYGFINRKGEIAIKARYRWVRDFSEGLAGFNHSGFWGFLNTKGDVVIKPKFNIVLDFQGEIAKVFIKGKSHSSKFLIGYIDKSGEYVWAPQR